MSTNRTSPLKTKGNRSEIKTSSRQYPARDADTLHRRVVVFETMQSAREIIKISIETASHTRQPERIIAF